MQGKGTPAGRRSSEETTAAGLVDALHGGSGKPGGAFGRASTAPVKVDSPAKANPASNSTANAATNSTAKKTWGNAPRSGAFAHANNGQRPIDATKARMNAVKAVVPVMAALAVRPSETPAATAAEMGTSAKTLAHRLGDMVGADPQRDQWVIRTLGPVAADLVADCYRAGLGTAGPSADLVAAAASEMEEVSVPDGWDTLALSDRTALRLSGLKAVAPVIAAASRFSFFLPRDEVIRCCAPWVTQQASKAAGGIAGPDEPADGRRMALQACLNHAGTTLVAEYDAAREAVHATLAWLTREAARERVRATDWRAELGAILGRAEMSFTTLIAVVQGATPTVEEAIAKVVAPAPAKPAPVPNDDIDLDEIEAETVNNTVDDDIDLDEIEAANGPR